MKRTVCALFLAVGFWLTGFSQYVDYTVPVAFAQDVKPADYKYIVDRSVVEVSKQYPVDSVTNGSIKLVKGSAIGATTFKLHNLVGECMTTSTHADWDTIIKEHFDNLFKSLAEQDNTDWQNYKKIKSHLSLRIYPKEFLAKQGGTSNLILKTDMEGTSTVLMLDLPGAFAPVPRVTFSHWFKDVEEVFAVAQSNVNHQRVQKKPAQTDAEPRMAYTILQNADYAASYALDVATNSPELMGDYGSVIAMPSKGTVYVFKVSKAKPLDMITYIRQVYNKVKEEYDLHPQRISNNFYWLYKGKFTRIAVSFTDGGNVTVTPPAALNNLSGGTAKRK